jgi:hypothetical protein
MPGKRGEQASMSGMEHAEPNAVSNGRLALVALLTLTMFGAGIALAARYGDFSMRRSSPSSRSMREGR